MDRQINGWIDRWMDGQTGGWIDERMDDIAISHGPLVSQDRVIVMGTRGSIGMSQCTAHA